MRGTHERPFRPVFEQGWHFVAIPILLGLSGILWVDLTLRYYERAERHERQGIVGFHYSMPEWGFEYRPNGRRIERWAFNAPTATTLLAIVFSAGLGSWRKRKAIGRWGVVGLCAIHFFAAAGFLIVTALIWVEAAAVFI